MKIPKTKTITELRNSLFETFEEVISGEPQLITHKNGNAVALISVAKIIEMEQEIELHKNLSIGYAQAMRGEGVSSVELKNQLEHRRDMRRKKNG